MIILGGRSWCRNLRRVSIDSAQAANLDSMSWGGNGVGDNIAVGSVVDIDSKGAMSPGVHGSQKRYCWGQLCVGKLVL